MSAPATDRTTYELLDKAAGWREAHREEIVEFGREGELRLEALPGTAKLFFNGGASDFECPAAAAKDECGVMYVLDAAQNRVARVNLATGEAKPIREFGGQGSDARQFDGPRGLAVLPGGGMAICDSGNHRVQVFSAAPHALLHLWEKAPGEPGDGPLEFRWPWGAAWAAGWLYIADRGNGRVQRVRADGSGWSEIGRGQIAAPTQVAVSSQGAAAVVDAPTASPARVVLFSAPEWSARPLEGMEDPRSVAFDSAGNLYVGTARGLVHKWIPDVAQSAGYKLAGTGVSGLDDAIAVLAPIADETLLAVVDENDVVPRRRLWTVATAGAFVMQGTWTSKALDSRIEECVWHRIAIEGTVPDGTSLQVDTLTGAEPGEDAEIASAGFAGARTAVRAGFDNPDGLVQGSPGRYLRLRLTMRSDGRSSPSVRNIKAYFPRQSYLQYLPANFHEDAESRLFLDRFLSIFQTSFDGFDRTIDNLWQLFDPLSIPARHYNWLAAWMALPVDPTWDLAKKRAMLKKAAASNLLRGTVPGLEEAIRDYAGVTGKIKEHFRFRRWPMLPCGTSGAAMSQYDARLCAATPLWSRAYNARLQAGSYSQVGSFRLIDSSQPPVDPFAWGASQFSVFFAADPYHPDDSANKVRQIVEQEKPAHAQAFYVPVYPRMRVGVQSSLGVDTYVARVTYTVLNRNASLGYDSILGATKLRKSIAALGASVAPRAGLDTRLL